MATYAANKEKYDTILLRVPKGTRDAIKVCAGEHNMSVNKLIMNALRNQYGIK